MKGMRCLLMLTGLVAGVHAFRCLHSTKLAGFTAPGGLKSSIAPSEISTERILDVNLESNIPHKKTRRGTEPEFRIAGDSTEVTPFQNAIVTAHFLLLAANMGLAVSSLEELSLIKVLGIVMTSILSIVLGDFGTGVFHWSVDNYGSINTPIFGSVCAAFQGHHQSPWTITFRPFVNNVYKIAIATVPALAVLALSPASGYLQLFFALFINWWLISQELHKYSHMKQLPPIIKFLQDNNIILTRKEHGLHHSSPFEGHYCILTGLCNPLLDKTNFFRSLEKSVFYVTGKHNRNW